MRTFPDPIKPKSFYLERVRRHREADELIRGTGWNGHRGCAVGCLFENYDHSLFPDLIGGPEVLAHLIDWIFEQLPKDHLSWPERVIEAIPEGADLSGVYPAWSVRLMDRNLQRIGPGEEHWRIACRAAVIEVRRFWEESVLGDDRSAWSAWSAARSAARSAWSAAWSAWSAESARSAWSAAESARSAEIQQQADDLLDLLRSAPISAQ
jgi:hypothetical protein